MATSGRPLPRIPEDSSFKWVVIFILLVIVCAALIILANRQAADQGGTQGATPSHQKSVPSPTVPDGNASR